MRQHFSLCSPRATHVTSFPAKASRAAKEPPTPPAPITKHFIISNLLFRIFYFRQYTFYLVRQVFRRGQRRVRKNRPDNPRRIHDINARYGRISKQMVNRTVGLCGKGIVSPLSAQYSPTATASCSRLMAIKTIRPSAPYLSYICCTSGNSQRQSPHAVLKNNMNEGCPCKLPLSTVRPSFITTVNSGNMSPTSTASGCMPASSFSLTQEETRDRNPIIK